MNRNVNYLLLGSSNHTNKEREENDFYATHPSAVYELLKEETFNKNIWECAVGEEHISKVLEQHNYIVRKSDIINSK